MAVFETTRPTADLFAGRLTHFVADLLGVVATWNDARITRNSLSKLSARELDDIGLSRGDIDLVSARITR